MKMFFLIAAAVVVLDQATKLAVTAVLPLHDVVEVVPGFFNLVHYTNKGAAFGILNKAGLWGKLALIAISAGAIVVIASLVRSSTDRLYALGLSLIAGGAAGNLIDRAWQGAVTDFLEFYAGSFVWPAFNVADTAITAGVALAVLSYILPRRG